MEPHNEPRNILYMTKIPGLCGLLAPIVALTCIGLSILFTPWFSWTENWLSDLGGFPGEEPTWAAHGTASLLFNVGLMIAGLLGFCFIIGIIKSNMFDMKEGRIGNLLLLLDTSALFCIGLFPETTGTPHTVFSMMFFFLVPLSLLLIGSSLIRSHEKALGRFTMILVIIALISVPLFLIPRPRGSNAVAEMFPIISVSAFAIVFGIKLLKQ